MGLHPLRWMGGGSFTGASDPPPLCNDCAVFLGWDAADIYCGGCRALRDDADRRKAEEQEREAEEHGGRYWSDGWWNGDD